MPARSYLFAKSSFLLVAIVLAATYVCLDRASVNAVAQEATEEPAAAEASKTATEGEAEATHEEQSALMWLIETSGWIGAVLLALSLWFVATTVSMFMELRTDIHMPPDLLNSCEDLLKKKDFLGLYKTTKADSSYFATLLTAGLGELPHGLTESREAMDRAGDVMVVDWERRISILAVLGTLGPMIGLLGTLKGMIASFSVIAMSDTQIKASAVAGGISEALVLTFEGVALSVPAIYFYSFFKNRIMALSTTAGLAADEFIRRVWTSTRSKSAPQAGESQA